LKGADACAEARGEAEETAAVDGGARRGEIAMEPAEVIVAVVNRSRVHVIFVRLAG